MKKQNQSYFKQLKQVFKDYYIDIYRWATKNKENEDYELLQLLWRVPLAILAIILSPVFFLIFSLIFLITF
ncbi:MULTISPECIES: hypothetical protein [Weeksella]|uniref:Glycosyl transferase, family 2 n=1 Tax=Weeksella virosa (strain ATCC 43766 / DSM 16922 / JCM 21250 / CCUG 30538 / CDC 9751 / IAM 14551 / NBRC 16016 / NCTC 11634 / CL345/78) TaxID=865938 RepID=F0P188_WEEVC|nr:MULTISPECIES: hypothetical protein [Weeksella]ADX67587.1 glycosyl transferase, family 2 [Weeksella virosa DSM 16922]MDK7375356.1 hypothetical protein [Weeksella virosa]MDK7676129.1 hypothetical protein [Weeksella virosa]OFM82946.1 hypothetical protein HMPREF2660_02635 [Weeksella sp. HMSC059D05]SUP53888.1 Uncharacterised protein [Weeksella virosa]